MSIVLMCPKCGALKFVDENNHKYDVCKYCTTGVIKVEVNESEFDKSTEDEMPRVKERVYRKFLYNNPQFDEKTFEKRLEDERLEAEASERKFASVRSSNTPKCPYCNSVYVEKITTGGRLLSTVFFGLGSSKVGKQWHCKQCKSNF